MGLAGRAVVCEEIAGNGLRHLVEHCTLHDTGATLIGIDREPYVRFVYSIESAILFSRQWLERPLPPMNAATRTAIVEEVHQRRTLDRRPPTAVPV